MLVADVTVEKIKSALWAITVRGDKAPGPNGYRSPFYKDSWNTIQHDVLEVVHDFLQKWKNAEGMKQHSDYNNFQIKAS